MNLKLGEPLPEEGKNIRKVATGKRNDNAGRLSQFLSYFDLVAISNTLQKTKTKLAAWISDDKNLDQLHHHKT